MKINEVTQQQKNAITESADVSADISRKGDVFGEIDIDVALEGQQVLSHPAVIKSKSGKVYVPATYSADVNFDSNDIGTEVVGQDPNGPTDLLIEDFSLTINKVVFDVYDSVNDLGEQDPVGEKVLHGKEIPSSVVQFINSKTDDFLRDHRFYEALVSYYKETHGD